MGRTKQTARKSTGGKAPRMPFVKPIRKRLVPIKKAPPTKFSQNLDCFKIFKKGHEKLADYAERINKECEKFDFQNCTMEDIKILLFFNGLQGRDAIEPMDLRWITNSVEAYYRYREKTSSSKKITLTCILDRAKKILDESSDSDSSSETYSPEEQSCDSDTEIFKRDQNF